MSGKRLPNGEEWLAAAMGTNDPGSSNGAGGVCVTNGSLRNAGSGTNCVSAWGAQDMIGNLAEWTADWFASVGTTGANYTAWPGTGYNADGNWGMNSAAYYDGIHNLVGLPSAALRGGGYTETTGAGVFALILGDAPSTWGLNFGVRCVRD
jgi:formylglycine-generating enzyme required for sulfatase activity